MLQKIPLKKCYSFYFTFIEESWKKKYQGFCKNIKGTACQEVDDFLMGYWKLNCWGLKEIN